MTDQSTGVPSSVLAAFGVAGPGRGLPGGAGRSFRHGAAVLKPVDDVESYEWSAGLLATIEPRGFRLPRPLRAADGSWVIEGWSATELMPGETGPAGHWDELFAAGRAFHAALAGTPRPAFLDARTHRWARADRVAWGEQSVEVPAEAAGLVSRLAQLKVEVATTEQLIHGDLSGNVLFAAGAAPAIIDFSPYWRPVAYADAIAVIDGLLWFGAGPDLLTGAVRDADFPQLLVRALLFRLIALTEQLREVQPAPRSELGLFAPVVALVERLMAQHR